MKLKGVDVGVKELTDLISAIIDLSDELKIIINNGLLPEDNWDAKIVAVADSGNANTEMAVTHGLGRIPQYVIAISSDVGGSIYNSGTANTDTLSYYKFTGANAALKLLIW